MHPFRTHDHILVFAALGSAALISLVVFDLELGNQAIPREMSFVPPLSQFYAITGPLRPLWIGAQSHLSEAFSDKGSDNTRALASSASQRFADHCLEIRGPDDLQRRGVDMSRRAVVAGLDTGYVLVVPVSDRAGFEAFAREMLPTPHVVRLIASEKGKAVKSIRIEPHKSSAVNICLSSGGRTSLANSGEDIPAKELRTDGSDSDAGKPPSSFGVEVHVAPDGSGRPASVYITCSATFADGSVGSCECQMDGGTDCGVPSELAQPTAVTIGEKQLVALNIDGTVLAFPHDDTAVIGSSIGSVQAAIREKENFAFFRSDDTFQTALRKTLELPDIAEGVLFGAVDLPSPPISGRAHFAAYFEPRRATLYLLAPIQSMEITALGDLLVPPSTSKSITALFPASLELKIDDPALSSYVRLAKQIRGASEAFSTLFGNFGTLIDSIADLKNVGTLQIFSFRLREGVPDIVVSLSIAKSEADKIIFEQRVRFRQARDEEIIRAAAKKYAEDRHELPKDIKNLTEYLQKEGEVAWDDYTITKSDNELEDGKPQLLLQITAPDYSAESFRGSTYRTHYQGHTVEYLPPGFTINDERYRMPTTGRDKIDFVALYDNRFRLAAYYSTNLNRLFVGTDLGALEPIIERENSHQIILAKIDLPGTKINASTDGRWLITQGLLYPNKDVNDFVRKYLLDLGQYRQIEVDLTPNPTERTLATTVSFYHD